MESLLNEKCDLYTYEGERKAYVKAVGSRYATIAACDGSYAIRCHIGLVTSRFTDAKARNETALFYAS